MGYTTNALNQYTAVNGVSLTYDDNGNLENDGTRTFTYDPQNRLLSVSFGTTLCEYGYDAAGRRIWKKTFDTSSGTVLTSYIEYCYDGAQIIAEYEDQDLNGVVETLARKFIYGPGIDQPICMIVTSGANAGTYFYHQDALGSVVALSKFDTGNGYASIVERYAYAAFGETIVCDGTGTPRTLNASAYGNPYMFTGREYDSETGLYNYRARMYCPQLGRFLQTDPIAYADGMNMYAYCQNNSLNYLDPSGTIKIQDLSPAYQIAKIAELYIKIQAIKKYNEKNLVPLNQSEGHLIVEESLFVLRNVRRARANAVQATLQRFGEHQDGTVANAYLHAYFNAEMTRSIGIVKAAKFADAHEMILQDRGPRSNLRMDLYNNMIGRALASAYYNNDLSIEQIMDQAIEQGLLKTIDDYISFEIVDDFDRRTRKECK